MQNGSFGIYNCLLSNLRPIEEYSGFEDEALENMMSDIQDLICDTIQLNDDHLKFTKYIMARISFHLRYSIQMRMLLKWI